MTPCSAATELPRPLGLVLAGGGALGAWQSAALLALERAGLRFDSVLGFSAGSLNGAAYLLDQVEDTLERWHQNDDLLRLRPRLRPPSIFSDEPIWRRLSHIHDDAAVRRLARCRLVISSARWQRDRLIYAEFQPDGTWDGPLALHLMASCAIPVVFPPVELEWRGERHRLLDGGVPTREPFSFLPLGPVKAVVVLEMVRPEEVGRKVWNPLRRNDQNGRDVCRMHMDLGTASLLRLPQPPAIYRLCPSRPLGSMLDFSKKSVSQWARLGAEDGRLFVANPAAFRV